MSKLSIFLFLFSVLSHAKTISSGPNQTALLELYTSEGCSSCPPADRWMSKLKKDKRLWKSIVPVAFHVDYWDYLGWNDRLSSKDYSQRQRALARKWKTPRVYTPGFMLNGQEWRGFHEGGGLPKSFPKSQLSLKLVHSGLGKKAEIQVLGTGKLSGMQAWVAILGFDVRSKVTKGENSGRKLVHDFAVLELVQTQLGATKGGAVARFTLPKPKEKAKRYGIAAWVAKKKSLRPIQAIGSYLN